VIGVALLPACATPTRYVVVSGERPLRAKEASGLRPIWVAEPEAVAAAGLIGLNTDATLKRYAAARPTDGPAVEALLFAVVSGDYSAARETLRARGAEIRPYLRLLVRADVTAETSPASSQGELLRLYQDAYDAQEGAAGRAVVELRVRQLRYGR
jgi:hypothetical protein